MKDKRITKNDSDAPHGSLIPRVAARWPPFPVRTEEKVGQPVLAARVRVSATQPVYDRDGEVLK